MVDDNVNNNNNNINKDNNNSINKDSNNNNSNHLKINSIKDNNNYNNNNDDQDDSVLDAKEPLGGFFAGFTRSLARVLGSISRGGIAGSVSGMFEETAGYPLDLAKTRIQLSNSPNLSVRKIFKEVIDKEGVAGLFKGLSSPLLFSSAISAIQFGTFEDTWHYLKKNNYNNNNDYINLPIAGAGAGFVQSFIACPVDLIKIQMQMEGANYHKSSKGRGNIYFAKQIYKERGLRGFYQGLTPTLLRDVPGLAIFFSTYELGKKKLGLDGDHPNSLATFLPILLCGGTAGVMYHGATHPFDISKTLIQTDRIGRYNGVIDCLKKIYIRDGVLGWFKGFGPVAIKSFQSNAVGFFVYELVMNI